MTKNVAKPKFCVSLQRKPNYCKHFIFIFIICCTYLNRIAYRKDRYSNV